MNAKEKHIIEVGMKLFATKGYYKTSIQDIATNAGISKGAFYLHFRSKEAFIAHSFQYFHNEIVLRIERIDDERYTPKQQFSKQITEITKYIYKYRAFIIMHLREDVSIGEHSEKLIRDMRLENVKWLREKIHAIYGEPIEDYLMDLVIQIDGLMKGYFQWIVLDGILIDTERFGEFIIERMDEIAYGMMDKKVPSIIYAKSVPGEYQNLLHTSKGKQINDVLLGMKSDVTNLQEDSETKLRLAEVVEMITKQMTRETYETVTIQGLLAHFNHIEALQQSSEKLARLLNIERLK